MRHPHSEHFHFPKQTGKIQTPSCKNHYFWDWNKCFRQDRTYRRWVRLFLAWLSSQGFSLQGHSSFRIHSLVFVLTHLSETPLIHSQYLSLMEIAEVQWEWKTLSEGPVGFDTCYLRTFKHVSHHRVIRAPQTVRIEVIFHLKDIISFCRAK